MTLDLQRVVLAGAILGSVGCGPSTTSPDASAPGADAGTFALALQTRAIDAVDILFVIDNSGSMRDNQVVLTSQLRALLDRLVNPPVDPVTLRPTAAPVRSLHVGVVSTDLGTPGSMVPSCASSDLGDDGLLNPIRNGRAVRQHQPWVTAPMFRPARCTMDPNQYPGFLTFDATSDDPAGFREDFACVAFLSVHGCGLEQPLEAAYRAVVVHNAREQPGNTDPNAGFLRSAAVFAILVLSDEEDGSVRDCRFAERDPQGRPAPCRDATSVFDTASPDWASPDLNLRFYLYREGSPEDPTWPLDRYIDLADPNRGYLSTKPAHPELVVFGAIAGVPLSPPRTLAGGVDYDALLGRDGMGGFTGMSPEGPVSMRHANMDPLCTQRVVPACFREGSHYEPRACDLAAQYFAWPSRRLAEVARRFGPNGVLGSICASSYAEPLGQLAEAIQRRLDGRCLPRALPTAPPLCPSTPAAGCAAAGTVVRVPCTVRELLPGTVRASEWCTAARGRIPAGRDPASGREACVVTQLPAPLGGEPPAGAHGFFYDTRPDPASPECRQRVSFTPGDAPPDGATARIVCTP